MPVVLKQDMAQELDKIKQRLKEKLSSDKLTDNVKKY